MRATTPDQVFLELDEAFAGGDLSAVLPCCMESTRAPRTSAAPRAPRS
jgi:hypothetical protein